MILNKQAESSSSKKSNRADLDYAVVIPAKNEERSIELVLNDLPHIHHVIVVDNGSSDRTASIAEACGAIVVTEPKCGYGAACLKGIDTAVNTNRISQNIPTVIAFVDADYSDPAHRIEELIEPILQDEADFVIGSRELGKREPGAMTFTSIWGNRLACFLMRIFFGHRYSDLGPMRAIRTDALLHLQMKDTNFGWTIEMQLKAIQAKLRIGEIPVDYRARIGTSKISGTWSGTIRAGTKILWTIAKQIVLSGWSRIPPFEPNFVKRPLIT